MRNVDLFPETLPIVFVTGLHRSGTSMLTELLATSSRMHRLQGTGAPEDEGQHVQRVLSTALAHGGPGVFAFDPGAAMTERHRLANEETARALLEAWRPYWPADLGPGEVLLEKTPTSLVRTRLFQALFPRARFVVITRHPGVVAASTRRWRPELAGDTLLRHWLTAHRRYRTDLPRLRACHELRYEDLVADPAGVLGRLCTALGLPDDLDTGLLQPDRSTAHLTAWAAMVAGTDPSTWRELDRGIRAFGYAVQPPYVLTSDPQGPPP